MGGRVDHEVDADGALVLEEQLTGHHAHVGGVNDLEIAGAIAMSQRGAAAQDDCDGGQNLTF